MNIKNIKRDLIFLAGDIRKEKCPLGFAWGKYPHLIDYDEAMQSLAFSSIGFIGLHRNIGDLSNIAINGFMKHAWLYTGDGIVEAVSEGVLNRSSLHGIMSDYAVILKPSVEYQVRKEAADRAFEMVGCPYDVTFSFDLEIEEELFKDKTTAVSNMQNYGLGVSCSEMVALCYVGHRRELGMFRTDLGKRHVILPDAFMSTHFEVVWASKHTTPENADKLGLHEEGCTLLKEYWEKQKCI